MQSPPLRDLLVWLTRCPEFGLGACKQWVPCVLDGFLFFWNGMAQHGTARHGRIVITTCIFLDTGASEQESLPLAKPSRCLVSSSEQRDGSYFIQSLYCLAPTTKLIGRGRLAAFRSPLICSSVRSLPEMRESRKSLEGNRTS